MRILNETGNARDTRVLDQDGNDITRSLDLLGIRVEIDAKDGVTVWYRSDHAQLDVTVPDERFRPEPPCRAIPPHGGYPDPSPEPDVQLHDTHVPPIVLEPSDEARAAYENLMLNQPDLETRVALAIERADQSGPARFALGKARYRVMAQAAIHETNR
jgi:hypothetical protein